MKRTILVLLPLVCVFFLSTQAMAQSYLDAGTYGLKIYSVNSAFYPFVMVYFRTFDANFDPLININPLNVGLMVKGRAYDPAKRQYGIQTLKERREGMRTVVVLDCSGSMAGKPFVDAISAVTSYIGLKYPADEVGIIALTDEVKKIAPFMKDGQKLEIFLNDLQATGKQTRIYDGIGAAIEMCSTAQGSTLNNSPDFVVLSNILLITDGLDEGSAMTVDNLMNEIANMQSGGKPPFPIYTLAYNTKDHPGLKQLAKLSARSFGRYWDVAPGSSLAEICHKIQEINRHDYVLTFRSYIPVDGMKYNVKLALNYEGRQMVDSAEFETMEVPMLTPELQQSRATLETKIPAMPDGNPYLGAAPGGAEIPAAPAIP